MSRRGQIGYPQYLLPNQRDWGGTLALPDGTVLRPQPAPFYETPPETSDGHTALWYIGGSGDYRGRAKANEGDVIILVNVIGTTSTNIGEPTNYADSNPWQYVKATNGVPINLAYSYYRVRMWWKRATFADAISTRLYAIYNGALGANAVAYFVIPRNAMDDDPAFDDDLGNYGLPNYVPTIAAVAAGPGGNPMPPRIVKPNVGNQFRNKGLFGQIVTWSSAGVAAYNSNTSPDISAVEYGEDERYPGFKVGYNTFTETEITCRYATVWVDKQRINSDGTTGRGVLEGIPTAPDGAFFFSSQVLNGQLTARKYDYSLDANIAKFTYPFLSMTMAPIMPYVYPSPTPGKTWADIADEFTPGTDLAQKWYLGTNRPDQSQPAIVDGRLRIRVNEQILHRYKTDFTGKSLVVGPIQYDYATSAGCNLYITLTITIDDIHTVEIKMFTVPSANGADIRWSLTDDGYTAAPAADSRGQVAIWDPELTKYWRIRESAGILSFEVSPDKLRWTGTFWGHELLKDQLAVLRPHFYVLGDGEAFIDGVNPVVPLDTREIPYESTWAFMGGPPELRDRWHGRDVLVGIADQGTTQAVRDAQHVNLVRRAYFTGLPPGNKEIFDYATHGCLVTPCGVPIGGRFVEAVISGSDGSSTASIIMSGILWCARQGAKTINLSFGGGGDDPIFDAIFAYIAGNFDTDISIAAGNSYAYGIELPAAYSVRYSNVHSVIAWDEVTNQRANFSNHHELASGCAPGRFVGGRHPTGEPVLWNGTSAASPHRVNLATRIQTGGRYSAGQAGTALDRNTRDTGQPTSEQGGGAFDLGRALAIAGDPTGTTNIPAISMPRFDHGEWDGVTDKLNTLIGAVEAQGRSCLVRYRGLSYLDDGTLVETNASLGPNQYGVVPWNSCDADSYGGMWDGSGSVVVPNDGLYLVVAQVRFGTKLVDGTTATGAPYNVGARGVILMLNGIDENANSVALDRQDASVDNEGITLTVSAFLPLKTDDFLFLFIGHFAGATIQCLQNDYGGNWMLVTRVAPLAPDLTGSLLPVTNLTAVPTRWDQLTVAWTPPATDDLLGVLLRRKTGTTPPASITDGDYLGLIKKGTTRYVDTDRAATTTYSYAAWAKSPGGYSPAATVTVTTSAKPQVPAPVTDITSSRRTNSEIKLSWTNPPNPDGNGVTRAGITIRRLEGNVAPTRPEQGVLLATLPADATTFTDTTVIPNGKRYGYSIFTFRAEQVYSVPATLVRSSAYNTNIFSGIRPGQSFGAGSFHPDTPVRDQVLPNFDGAFAYDTALLAGTYFWVTRPAVCKGFRFLRARPNMGTIKAALFEWEADPTFDAQGLPLKGWAYRRSPDVRFGTSAAYSTWEDAVLTDYVRLIPKQIYVAIFLFPDTLYYTRNFFSDDSGNTTPAWARKGLMDPTGLLRFGGVGVRTFDYTLGEAWPNYGNMAMNGVPGVQYGNPPVFYEGPIPSFDRYPLRAPFDPGTNDYQRGYCYYLDVTVNEDDD